MDQNALFTIALNLSAPWKILEIKFIEPTVVVPKNIKGMSEQDRLRNAERKQLHIYLTFDRGSKFACPDCGEMVSAYDTSPHQWRHLNFFEYECYIHADLPRVKCHEHGVKTVNVPWARPSSGFTLLFESMVVLLSQQMTPTEVARTVYEHDTLIWRILKHYVGKAREYSDFSNVTAIGFDETSTKGQNYITVVANLDADNHKVLYVTEGKDKGAVDRFKEDFISHKGAPEKITVTTSDMAIGFIDHVKENFINSEQVIDKFHVIKAINNGVDAVRKDEVKEKSFLKQTKYLWLRNEKTLSEKQLQLKMDLMRKHPKVGRAYSMRVELQNIYEESTTRMEAEERLDKLCSWMRHSRLEPMKKVASTLKNHKEQILNYFENKYTNAILEGLNSIIQNVKRKARGFRNTQNFILMIYLVTGDIKLDYVLRHG